MGEIADALVPERRKGKKAEPEQVGDKSSTSKLRLRKAA
jgi:hypothetical protein